MDSYSNSLTAVDCALIDGAVGFSMTDSAATGSSYPSWAYFFDLEVDHSLVNCVTLLGGLGFHAVGSWIGSCLSGTGILQDFLWKGESAYTDCRVVGHYQHGFLINKGVDTQVNGGWFCNNSVESSGTYHGIVVAAGIVDFSITGIKTGYITPFTSANQGYGVIVLTGASDYYTIQGCRGRGNVTGSVSDGGTGSHKSVANNV